MEESLEEKKTVIIAECFPYCNDHWMYSTHNLMWKEDRGETMPKSHQPRQQQTDWGKQTLKQKIFVSATAD